MIYLSDFSRALIRWIPRHLVAHGNYSLGTLREACTELREAADYLENTIRASVAAGANSPDEPELASDGKGGDSEWTRATAIINAVPRSTLPNDL